MSLENLPEKPNIVLIVTDQEREVMHWPEGWAEENLPARSRLMANGLTFRNAHCVTAATSSLVAGIMIGQLRSLRRKIRDILGPLASEQRAYSALVDIDAPAEDVWDVVTDFQSYPTWNPLLSNVEGELDTGGELRVSPAFAPTTVKATVTEADRPNRFEWEDHVPLNLLTPVFSVQLLPLAENRTRVIIAETFTGPLLSILGRRLDRQMPGLYDAMGEALAQQVEQHGKVSL